MSKRGRPTIFATDDKAAFGFTTTKRQVDIIDTLASASGKSRSAAMRELVDIYGMYLARARINGSIKKLQNVLDKGKRLATV